MRIDGRPDHIEDYVVSLKAGSWFNWTDSKNKIYANLIITDGSSKPTGFYIQMWKSLSTQ